MFFLLVSFTLSRHSSSKPSFCRMVVLWTSPTWPVDLSSAVSSPFGSWLLLWVLSNLPGFWLLVDVLFLSKPMVLPCRFLFVERIQWWSWTVCPKFQNGMNAYTRHWSCSWSTVPFKNISHLFAAYKGYFSMSETCIPGMFIDAISTFLADLPWRHWTCLWKVKTWPWQTLQL